MNRSVVSGMGNVLAVLMAVVAVVTVSAAGIALLRNHNDARGWAYTTFPDGHTEWQSVPQTPGHLGSGILHAPDGGKSGFTATSDIITNSEASVSGSLLLLAWIEMGTVGIYTARRFRDGTLVS
ncbi:hypothetical protein [Dehalogenimonas formicexedens]|nr:hypothetical protein [Dehalogenimonas formicexedens]